MDIPSIKFRYFEKLKLWHDFLSPDSVFETQKKSYWDHEKIILLWAFSDLHGHLYTSVSNGRLLDVYSLRKDEQGKYRECDDGEFYELKKRVNNSYKNELDELRKDMKRNTGKINYVMGNLAAKGFAIVTEEGDKGVSQSPPKRIRINPKGLLLGELLYEAYCDSGFWKIKFRKYRWGLDMLKLSILAAALIFISVFLDSVLFPIFDYIRLMDFVNTFCK